MKEAILKFTRIGALAVALTTGGFTAHSVVAQDATPVSTEVAETADDVKEEAEGFDDWGLLGLLGLGGLLGLTRKAPQPVIHEETRTPVVGTGVNTADRTRVVDNDPTVRH